jgi:hypothetical protein
MVGGTVNADHPGHGQPLTCKAFFFYAHVFLIQPDLARRIPHPDQHAEAQSGGISARVSPALP